MNAESLVVGLQRVDADFCRGALGASGFLCTPGALTAKLSRAAARKLTYEWGVLVRETPLLVAKGKVEILASSIRHLQLESVETARTKARLVLDMPPLLTCGMQAWDARHDRRGNPEWSSGASSSNAALPPLLCNELLRATVHEVVFMHTRDKVEKEFKQIGVELSKAMPMPASAGALPKGELRRPATGPAELEPASPAAPQQRAAAASVKKARGTPSPRPGVESPASAACASPAPTSKRTLEASAKKAKQPKLAAVEVRAKVEVQQEAEDGREMGSNGQQCDWCGMVPAEGDGELKVCKRCHYTCCTECSAHQAKGTCYCKDSNFGEPYPRGAARKRHMTGSW
mmetsp:Transcript_64958/g.209200  ORF Transcript_64958/g.209200 Transcript_64958/m.209200 type:complete len:344 (+) Transcript_64958:71-1102(+)